MARKFKITEEQRNALLKEGVTIQAATDSTGKLDTAKTAQDMSSSGIDPKKVNVQAPGSAMTGGSDSTTTTTTTEHRIITKKELAESRRRYLKENSEIFTFDNFIKQLH